MARARNIKPGLFKNEILGEADPIYSLLFIGLWTLADREGRLENRPKRIRAELFPYRFDLDVSTALAWLNHESFISIYDDGHKSYIQVNNWKRHQSPHHKEVASEIPSMAEAEKLKEKQEVMQAQAKHEASTDQAQANKSASSPLIPDSGYLIPDCLNDSPEPVPDSRPPVDESPVVIVIPTNKFNTEGEEYPVTEKQILDWQQTYPAVDVMQSLRQIRSWNLNNQAKRKTMRGMAAHIDKWLARDQDRGGNLNATHQPNRRESLAERSWRESEEILADIEAREACERSVAEDAPAVWPQVGQPGGSH